jgi:pre-mRNA-processing factor 39
MIAPQTYASTNATPVTTEALESAIKENPSDYYKWEEYVRRIEAEGDKQKLKSVYDQLLIEFPLMYGYWKKYADAVNDTTGNIDSVIEIYERGVQAVLYSVDLWVHYCVYVAEKSNDLTQIRNVFERAISRVGYDYLAAPLWDQYINFEISQDEYKNVSQIYSRLIRVPLPDHARYFTQYQQHMAGKSITDLATPEELEKLRQISPSETSQLQTFMSWKEQEYRTANEELERITPFEKAIERPYFHVQPLDEKQLENWRRYLESEEVREDITYERMRGLYEKCLVACCMYMEFWKRYLRYLEKTKHFNEARAMLIQLTNVYRKRIPESYLIRAAFEEQNGDTAQARSIYKELLDGFGKNHLESALEYIYFERRQLSRNSESLAQIYDLFDSLREGLDLKSKVYLDIQRASFAFGLLNDVERARTILKNAVSSEPGIALSWLGLIEFEAKQASVNYRTALEPLFDRVINEKELAKEDKVKVLERLYEYSSRFGDSVQHTRAIGNAIIDLKYAADAKGTKRKAEDGVDDRSVKVPRTTSPNTTATDYATQQAQQAWYAQYGANYANYYTQTMGDGVATQYASYYGQQ